MHTNVTLRSRNWPTFCLVPLLFLFTASLFSSQPVSSATVFFIEAEDFNHGSGQHVAAASTMPYFGGAYNGLSATGGVDFNQPGNDGSSDEYRIGEIPNVPMTFNGDLGRGTWQMTSNHRIGWTDTSGDWYNYTRNFPAGVYKVSAALSHSSTDPGALAGSMQRVTAGANTPNQTLVQLGTFSAPGSGGWGANNLVPLKNADGSLAAVTLNGLTTIRFTAASGDIDYYKFEPLLPPDVIEHPANISVVEGTRAEFRVRNATDDPVNYRWQRNQEDIPNANGPTLVLDNVPLSESGTRYRVILTNSQGSDTSNEGVLTVTRDVTLPTVVKAVNVGATAIHLTFSENVRGATATIKDNYQVNGGVTVNTAAMSNEPRKVILTTTTLTMGTVYTITVNGVTDNADQPNTIAANSQIQFTAIEYAPEPIGTSGEIVAAAGGFDVTAGGARLTGGTDQFFYGYQQRTGDFDLRVRIAGAEISDAFFQAGLMARANLSASSAFAGVFSGSPQLGAFFQNRTASGGAIANASPFGGYPVNYSQMWLRLRRVGNAYTGFASFDGTAWTQLGTTTANLGATVYFGMAVSSSNPNSQSRVEFRDLGAVVSPTTAPVPRMEKMGATSRRSGVVLSEIMYHPRERVDQKELEFIELYNAGSIFEDLSGFTISGQVEYAFPPGTILPAGGFVVIAKAPADVKAVHGLRTVLGPWNGSLANDSGRITISDEQGNVMQEVVYDSEAPWPAAADGAGSSLVIYRPSYGEEDVRAWRASTFIGGSPGNVDPVVPDRLSNIVINEFLAHTDAPLEDFIELYNHSNVEVDVSNAFLSDNRSTNKFKLPAETRIPARGYLAFRQSELQFALDSEGETIYLIDPTQTRVLDAVKFGAQENGVSSGRSPDGNAVVRRLASVTEEARNSNWRANEVVINELMYSPISGDSDDEYVELHNPGASAVSLEGWQMTGGIDFTFPPNSSIPAGGFLVLGKNKARLLANYAQLNESNTVGDYDGSLDNGGERIALAKPDLVISTNEFEEVVTSTIFVVVSEVTYKDGGRWGQWSDGGGSSLELIDPRADLLQPDNWADSDETTKGTWSTISVTGLLDHGMGGFDPNELQLVRQGAGEAMLDDIEVLQGTTVNRVSNPGFESSLSGWQPLGNHSESVIATTGAATGSRALRIVSGGRGDTGPNQIDTALNSTLTIGQSATIRAKVKWLKGWPEIILRTKGSWLELFGIMEVPKNLGSPGLANGRRVNNAGPAIYEVSHWPVLPQGTTPALITARVSDPDAVNTVNLRHRVDGGNFTTTLMRDDGTGVDAVAGDGLYSANLAPSGAGATMVFYVEAIDGSGALRRFPIDAPVRENVVRWGLPIMSGTFPTYHVIMTSATAGEWGGSDPADNTYRNMTFLYSHGRAIYNGGVKHKGSPWHGGAGDFFVVMPEDEPMLGVTDMALCSTGNAGDEPTFQREQVAMWISRKMGGNYLNRRYVKVYINGNEHRTLSEDAEEPNGDYARSRVPERSDGDLYKVEDWFEYDNGGGRGNVDATLQPFLSGGSYKTARYRWDWRKRAVEGSANNFTNLFNLVTAVNTTGSDYERQVEQQVDMRNWMRIFAMQRIVGNWDAYGLSRGKNAYIYKGEGVRWEMFPWDIDFVLGFGSNGANDALWGSNDPTINRMFDNPTFQRILWQCYLEAVEGPLNPANYSATMDERYRILQANGIGASSPQEVKTYMDNRRQHIVGQMNAANAANFAITSNNGNNFSTNRAVVRLNGRAPFAVYTIEVNGVAHPVRWTSVREWELTIPLTAVQNTLVITGLDRFGQLVAAATDTITITYTGVLLNPADWIAINEIMYNPIQAGASFIEIYNRHQTAAFDLSGHILNGLAYTFPEGSIIQPNSYLVLAGDRAVFTAVYGSAVLVHGEFQGGMDNGGERLSLIKPGATAAQDLVIDQVRYDDDPPWPVVADGQGPSLQLIDAAQDNWRPANWGATAPNAANRATPGGANANRATLAAFPQIWLNEVVAENISGPADRFGDNDPWVEIYNAGETPVDLGGLFLANQYASLAQWAFPAGTQIQGKSFLVVWLDGEGSESAANELHASFRLEPGSGSVVLSRTQGSGQAVVDNLNYLLLGAGRSYGSFPDGLPTSRRLSDFPTPGAQNNATLRPITVFINEWMASNTRTLRDPADSQFEDWLELYNAGSTPVDLSLYYLTDNLTNEFTSVIPQGTVIPAGGYLLVWADDEANQNGPGRDLHAAFRLGTSGEEIGLFAPDGTKVDSVKFGAQQADVSQGRASDGAEPPFISFATPSPKAANVAPGGNQPPVLAAIGSKVVNEGELLEFTAQAADPDAGQTLSYSLGADAPAGATIHAQSGVFAWRPTEADGPGPLFITVRVADNGVPVRTTSERILITVNEVNAAPVIEPIADQTIAEGSSLIVTPVVSDLDLPRNTVVFALESGPGGVQVNSTSGEISWVPGEEQGPGDYTIVVRATDNGTPVQTSTRSFGVHVNEVNNAPVMTVTSPDDIDEGETLTVTLRAVDPDSPPATVLYSLVSGPEGATVNPTTGELTWSTSEATPPGDYVFTVRATENTPEQLITSRSFTVTVNELNQPPVLDAVAEIQSEEGATVRFTATARDEDQPPQTLTFSMVGAPAGATLNASSGEFRWDVPENAGNSTHSFLLRVTDNWIGQEPVERTVRIIVKAKVRLVINEIMHNPTVANAEYIELYNASASLRMDLSGWKLGGRNLAYTFPAGTMMEPGAFLVVARNSSVFAATYGAAVPVVGNWSGTFDANGDTLELFSGTDELIDRVTYHSSAPWDNTRGAALQLVDARQDNNRPANWATAAPYTGNTNLVRMTDNWKFYQAGQEPPLAWRGTFDDASWGSGGGLLYVEQSDLPGPKTTPLTLGALSYYFRARFNMPVALQSAELALNTIIDDGAVVYINGREVFRLRMPETGTILYDTPSTGVVDNATFEGPFTLRNVALQQGENILAIEVHQVNPGSSDIVLGAELTVVKATVPSLTPGMANSVTATLPAFDSVYINELVPVNVLGATDNAGDRDPWMELHNPGTMPVDLGAYYLTTSYPVPNSWQFPQNTILQPGAFMVVWLDGEPGETQNGVVHSALRVEGTGSIALVRAQNGGYGVVDFINYATPGADVAVASIPDGQLDARQLTTPTPGAPNRVQEPDIEMEFTLLEDGQMRLSWGTQAGTLYILESSSDLQNWLEAGRFTATGASVSHNVPTNQDRLFYRVTR